MKSSSAIHCILGACLASAFLAPESLGIITLLCMLPYAHAQSNENTWLSLNGESGEKHTHAVTLSLPSNSVFTSGYHDRGYPNYDAIVTTQDNNGELTSNLQIEIGTSSTFFDSALYQTSVLSAGHFIDGQRAGLLCETSLNSDLMGCSELTGTSEQTSLSTIKVRKNNNLLIAGENGFFAERHQNGTLKFAFKYGLQIWITSITETDNDEYILTGNIFGAQKTGITSRHASDGTLIWMRQLQSDSGGHLYVFAAKKQLDTLIISGDLNYKGAVFKLNATTGETLSVQTTGGAVTTFADNVLLSDGSVLSVGRTTYTSVGSHDAIGMRSSKDSTFTFKVAGTKIDRFTSVFLDDDENVIIAGDTASYTESLDFNKAMTIKLSPDLLIDSSGLP